MLCKIYDQEAAARKEAKRHIKIALQTGGTVPYSLAYMLDIKCSLKTIQAVYRDDKEKARLADWQQKRDEAKRPAP